jgi:hypothetical protein
MRYSWMTGQGVTEWDKGVSLIAFLVYGGINDEEEV